MSSPPDEIVKEFVGRMLPKEIVDDHPFIIATALVSAARVCEATHGVYKDTIGERIDIQAIFVSETSGDDLVRKANEILNPDEEDK